LAATSNDGACIIICGTTKPTKLNDNNIVVVILMCLPQTGSSYQTCTFNASLSVTSIASWRYIDSGSELALQQAVALVGPVSAAIDASSAQFQVSKLWGRNDDSAIGSNSLITAFAQECGCF